MADCNGLVMQVAVLEDGTAAVDIPIENWRDVKGVHGIGIAEGLPGILHADRQVRIYGGPSGVMLDVCVELMNDEEKAARDQADKDALHGYVDQVHELQIHAAAAEVQAAQDNKSDVLDGEDAELANAERAVQEAEAALERAKEARDKAHAEVDGG
jgi:flagellar hook-basal body complex protein FliE